MLDNRTGRYVGIHFGNQFKGRIGVVNVIEGKFFTLDLFCRSNTETFRAANIKTGILMRVFTISE